VERKRPVQRRALSGSMLLEMKKIESKGNAVIVEQAKGQRSSRLNLSASAIG
jgi:hypothetical protein